MRSARTLLRGEAGYPARLAAAADAPPRLRLAGDLGSPGLTRVALVGSRDADEYGLEVTRALASGLARAGVSVVSGGARGVDGAAHAAALDAGGHTVVVMGTGVDVDYPAAHARLFARVLAAGGALLSEQEDGTQGAPWNFPRRNRIISGISDAVVVVRAGEKSGALITAEWARGQGVPVLAVPGNVDHPLSLGPLRLLQGGARAVGGAADVLAALGLSGQSELPLPGPRLEGPAAAVYGALSRSPQHADELARAAGLPPGTALAALLELELSGLAEQRPGQRFLRKGPGG